MEVSCKFDKVIPTPEQTQCLFNLLAKRVYPISHLGMPTFEEHSVFVKKNPYRVWYIVISEEAPVGTVYLTNQNTLGLNFEKDLPGDVLKSTINFITSRYEPLPPIPSIRNASFTVNASLENNTLINTLVDCGARLIQQTYILGPPSSSQQLT